ncbi:helix-turn-helix domain-containing protein [Paracoccus marinus]|uniref:helix-turn-helix domain-containing protein n=1 Tax=Paracoccus marinus TaxID=288426 RepID=UPI00103FAA70|nr:helix-turn-helix transcriptional regulator [Paracoccus marinus]
MAHSVDLHVGRKLRQRRWLMGMTQQQLADRVGIKFQQIQKYETGANRVAASRLWEMAEALDVSPAYFFDGLLEHGGSEPTADVLNDKEALQLMRSYYAMPQAQRRQIFELARVLSHAA